jgi:hypothetical protein
MGTPKNHIWQTCMCPICTRAREKGDAILTHAGTLKELYQKRRNGHLSIWGTALGAYSAFWQWFLINIMWGKCFFRVKPVGEPVKDLYQKIHVPDGYALVLLSPVMIIWWVFCSGIILFCLLVIMGYFLILGSLYLILSAPYPVLALYAVIFEFPASIINRDLGEIDYTKYSFQNKWDIYIVPIIIAFILIVLLGVGFINWAWLTTP